MALVTAGASAWFMASGRGVNCEFLAPLTVLATLAAFLISVCFRQMARHLHTRSRLFLAACLLLAAATLFTDFRFVRRYRGFCQELRQQMPPSQP